jgi:prepilin-type N-terminal cleavage/methylation domain-containing protein
MNSKSIASEGFKSISGFTLLELMTTVFVLGLLCTIAFPSYKEWQKNLIYRKAARDVVMVFRETRSRAIRTNREHRIEFEADAKKYRVLQGNRASNSSEWKVIILNWTVFPAEVVLSVNETKFQMNTNGTANGGTITIKDTLAIKKYAVTVNRTGRIRTT